MTLSVQANFANTQFNFSSSAKFFDLIIIGGGPGGYETAAYAGKHGLKTLLIEKNELGGTCLNSGCIPVKTLLSSIHFYHNIRKKAGLFNINITDISLDYAKLIERKDRLIVRMRKSIEKLLADSSVIVIKGKAELKGKSVSVNGENYQAKNIIIATGSTPAEIAELKPDGKKIFNSDQILELKTIPKKLDIVGAGVIGLEFADIFSRLGAKVTLYDIAEKILPNEDTESVELIRKTLEKNGCDFKLSSSYTYNNKQNENFILLAAGRKSQKIKVNQYLETETSGVYAIGDCNGLAFYAHAATFQGLKVIDNILSEKPQPIDLSIMPRVLFTSPQLAAVGKISGKTYKFPLAFLGRAQTENNTDGFVKLFVDEQDIIVGASIVADNADALIGEAIVLVNKKVSIEELKNMIHPHPTWTESYALSVLA